MRSGGLAPPPPGSGPPPPAPTYPTYPSAAQRQLEEAEHSDSGRGLEFLYFNVAGGGEFASLGDLQVVPPGAESSGFGPYFSAGAGLRLLFLTVGPSFRYATFSDWNLWTLNLDLGWHIPLGSLEPYAMLGGGFAKVGYREGAFGPSTTDVSTSGFDIRIGGGVDYYLSSVFSVGAALQGDLLRLSHSQASGRTGIVVNQQTTTVGFVVTGGAVVGLHF